jgi:hypothetical protein
MKKPEYREPHLSKRIIISGRERILSPLLSFVMSLFFTGMGEIYSGSPQRGIAFALIRGVSLLAVPFYSMTNIKSSYLTEVFISLMFFCFITFLSPLCAVFISLKKKKITISGMSSLKFIVLSGIFNSLLTLVSITLFFSFFSIMPVNYNYPPIIEEGDIAVIKKSEDRRHTRGEMVVLKNETLSMGRVIGIPGEEVVYDKGRFSLDESELFLSIFTENELMRFSLSDFDVISETNGEFKYPVIQNRDKFKLKISLKDDTYFTAPDDRNDLAGFAAVKPGHIYGRLEGLLFSFKRTGFLIKPFRPAE